MDINEVSERLKLYENEQVRMKSKIDSLNNRIEVEHTRLMTEIKNLNNQMQRNDSMTNENSDRINELKTEILKLNHNIDSKLTAELTEIKILIKEEKLSINDKRIKEYEDSKRWAIRAILGSALAGLGLIVFKAIVEVITSVN